MSDQTPQGREPWPNPPQQPGWGPPQPPSAQRKRRPGVLGWIGIGLGVLVVLVVIGAVAGQGDSSTTVTTTPAAAGQSQPAVAEPETAEPPETSRGPMTATVGKTIAFEDSFGKHSADVTVVRKAVSTGDEFTKPDNGVYIGLFVRVKAFQDGISVPSFYALVGGKHYEASCCLVERWKPDLATYSNLNNGETAEGWILLDVPSRSGKLVMQEFLSEKAQAVWTY